MEEYHKGKVYASRRLRLVDYRQPVRRGRLILPRYAVHQGSKDTVYPLFQQSPGAALQRTLFFVLRNSFH